MDAFVDIWMYSGDHCNLWAFTSSDPFSPNWSLTTMYLVGPRTQKTLEAPCRSLVMDVGQVERDLRACTPLTVQGYILKQ